MQNESMAPQIDSKVHCLALINDSCYVLQYQNQIFPKVQPKLQYKWRNLLMQAYSKLVLDLDYFMQRAVAAAAAPVFASLPVLASRICVMLRPYNPLKLASTP
jgi:hypothetical protein